MKKKIILPLLTLSSLTLYYFWAPPTLNKSNSEKTMTVAAKSLGTTSTAEASPTQTQPASEPTCSSLLESTNGPYSLSQVQTNPSLSERFHNRHLEYQGAIYRLRNFYDDANEGEQLTFLVYIEDEDEFAHIRERSPLIKGKQYLKLEELLKNGEAQLIYDEIGVTIQDETHKNEIFLRYLDGKLNTIQGRINGRHLECLGE